MKRSIILAALVALGAAAWVLSGLYGDRLAGLDDARPAVAEPASPAAAESKAARRPMTVRVLRSQARDHIRQVTIYGRTEALRTVEIKAETAGRVVELQVARGQRVKAGEIIAQLAMDDRDARLRQAKALARQREIEFTAARTLKEKGYRAETAFAGSMASRDAALAQVAEIEVDIAKTRIKAPFDGVIERQAAELGAYLKVGETVATLVDDDPLLAVGQISETDVARLPAAPRGSVQLAGAEPMLAPVRFIAAAAEPETRTFRLELELPNPEHRFRAGLTAELRLPLGAERAHLLSPAALTLDDLGRIGVRAVGEDGRVAFHPVAIAGDSAEGGVWLAGLPELLDVIVVGQDYVREGDQAIAVPVGGPAS